MCAPGGQHSNCARRLEGRSRGRRLMRCRSRQPEPRHAAPPAGLAKDSRRPARSREPFPKVVVIVHSECEREARFPLVRAVALRPWDARSGTASGSMRVPTVWVQPRRPTAAGKRVVPHESEGQVKKGAYHRGHRGHRGRGVCGEYRGRRCDRRRWGCLLRNRRRRMQAGRIVRPGEADADLRRSIPKHRARRVRGHVPLRRGDHEPSEHQWCVPL